MFLIDTTLGNQFYKAEETKQFENIECEWPIMVCFLIIDGIFKGNEQQVKEYHSLLMGKLVRRECFHGDYLLPKYYYTPFEYLDAERAEPGSTPKVPSVMGSEPNCLYLMGQAVFIITQLLTSGFLHINELDPIRRYMPSYNRPRKTGRYSAFQVGLIYDKLIFKKN